MQKHHHDDDDPDWVRPKGDKSEFDARVPGHRPNYSLRDLVPLYGTKFCRDLGVLWPKIAEFEPESSSVRWFSMLKMAFRSLAQLGEENPSSPCGQAYRHYRDHHSDRMDYDTFYSAMSSVATAIARAGKGKVKDRSRASRIETLNAILKRLARFRFVPSIEQIPVNIEYRREALPSMAELTRTRGVTAPVETDALSFDSHAEALLDLNVARRDALRAALETDLLIEYEAFRNGQEWLNREDLPSADEFDEALKAVGKLKLKRPSGLSYSQWLKERLKHYFNLTSDEELFPLVVRQFHFRFPNGFSHKKKDRLYSELFGGFGTSEIARHLASTSISTTAAFGLLLIETAFNISSLEDLPCDPYVGAARHGHRVIATVAARKIRANGKIVEGSIESTGLIEGEAYVRVKGRNSSLSGGDVVRIYLEMSKPLRDRASTEVAEMFWLVTAGRSSTGGPVSNYLGTMAVEWWPKFLKRHEADPVIGGLPITRQHIRSTELQINAARGGFGHELAQAIADHARDSTTMGYLGAGWFRKQLARQVREFMGLLEAVFVHRVPDVETRLGLTAEAFRSRLDRARDVGLDLDFGCSGTQPPAEERAGSSASCTPLIPCDLCPVRHLVPSDESFRNLHLVHTALVRAEPAWIVQNPQRWMLVWMPWRAITEAYVRMIAKSPYKLQFARICKAVDTELAGGDVVLPIIA